MSETEEKQLPEAASEPPKEQQSAAEASTEAQEPKDEPTQEATEDSSARAKSSPSAENGQEKKDKSKADTNVSAKAKAAPSGAKSQVEEDVEEYAPGTSVQVKIQGYPWWPAIVVTPDHFPQAALNAKPATKTRKDGTTATTYPVQFLGSPEYYWSRPTDIKRLTHEDVQAWIDSGKKSSTKGLKAAYQQALEPPTLDELMKAKKDLEAKFTNDEDEDEDEEMPDEPEEEEESEIELDDEGKPVKKSKAKRKAASRTPKKTPSKTPTKKRKTDNETETSTKKARTPRSNAKPKEVSPPSSPELSPEEARKKAHEQRVKNVMFIRHKLQKCLLGKDVPDDKLLDEVPSYLDKLDSVEASVDLFRETKIGKVLVRVNKLENIPRDDKLGIKEHVTKLLDKWQEVMDLQKKKDEEDAGGKNTTATKEESAAAKEPAVKSAKDEPATNGHVETSTTKEEAVTTE